MTDQTMTKVEIPGIMTARVMYGNIVGFDFMPWGAFAGYFGPSMTITEGPEILEDNFWDMVANKLTHDYYPKSSTITCHWTC